MWWKEYTCFLSPKKRYCPIKSIVDLDTVANRGYGLDIKFVLEKCNKKNLFGLSVIKRLIFLFSEFDVQRNF